MRVALGVLVLVAGCIRPQLDTCQDLTCPIATRCVLVSGTPTCASASQLLECAGLADLVACQEDGVCIDQVCVGASCGNGRVELAEQCDDGNLITGDGCSALCANEVCGNGITDVAAGEACDCGAPGMLPRPECDGRNNSDTDPSAPCRANCTLRRCGDGILEAPELCEGGNVGALTCASFGYYGGTLGCTAFCSVDVTQCVGRCNDGMLDANEVCDAHGTTATSDDLFAVGVSCDGLGRYGSGKACTPFCTFDLNVCAGRCGNNVLELQYEQCEIIDGVPALQGQTCATLQHYPSLTGGGLECNPVSCRFSTENCGGRCGDGMLNGPEECEVQTGSTLYVVASCGEYRPGLTGGALSCVGTACRIDPTTCEGCGNNVCDANEDCSICPLDCGDCCSSPWNLCDCTNCPQNCDLCADCNDVAACCGVGRCDCTACAENCGTCDCGVCDCTECPQNCDPCICGACDPANCPQFCSSCQLGACDCTDCPSNCDMCTECGDTQACCDAGQCDCTLCPSQCPGGCP